MRARYLLIGLVVVLTVVTGVLIYQGSRAGTTASESPVTITQTTTAAADPQTSPYTDAGPDGSSTAAATGAAAPTGDRAASNVPMTKLNPGDTAPQFIIFSFDGAGSHTKWQEFLAAAAPTNSRFNGFLTGLYLLADENKTRYTGPGHAPGKSSVGVRRHHRRDRNPDR